MTVSKLDAGSAVSPDESLIRFEKVPSYAEFQERCLLPNRPCIFPPGLIAHWPIVQTRAWALPPSQDNNYDDKVQKVNWEALKQAYPTHTSPVVITRTDPNGETQEERTEMTISAAIDLISDFKQNKFDGGVQSVYIKDWHLIKQISRESVEPYTVPDVFADDWMNNVSPGDAGKEVDDFRFVYAGTVNSRTLLHRDVYTSYSWSSNVVGSKRWYLFPPRSIPHLRRFPNVKTSELIPDIQTLLSTITPTSTHSAQQRKEYPHLHQAYTTVQIIDQTQGETIFIPSNWYHQVENLTETISINRNWCNSVNLPSLYQSIVDELQHVEESLCDVKEMLSSNDSSATGEGWKEEFFTLIQDVAVQDAGWAWAGFWDMVVYNLEHPATASESRPKDGWMRERLRPLVDDFAEREDARWLNQKILEIAKRCKILLEAMGD
ncbi:uncharacterized protein UTRI_00410_B [Ustilago trichophora]|uniref:JmjC domain-containing protein n=1 Tax=Ustilago trichophora TaxID=86804 RepID=A0A5C3DPF1_9BASI|nr:uncharacterized protein UTRI_00410_B [Ustilago trichophora]